MSVVCGLDLSLTSAGVAILVDGQPKLITHVGHGGKNGASYAQRSRRVVSQCQAVMAIAWAARGMYGLDLAVIEGPSYGDNMPSNHDRAGLWWGVYSALAAKQIPIAVIAPSTLKLWFTGDGHASKLRMLDTARAMFREAISTHDEADSVACAVAGAWHLGDPMPPKFGPMERQIDALLKVEWPGPRIPMASTEHVGFRAGGPNG